MKKYYKSLEYRAYNYRHSKKLFSRRQKYKKWKNKKRKKEIGLSQIRRERLRKGYSCVDMPVDFSFLSNTSEFLKAIEKIRLMLVNERRTYINLDDVKEIDNGAITILLSLMTDFKLKGIYFNGSFPQSPVAKELLLSSGFFEHLFKKVNYEMFNENSRFAYGKINQIITKPGKLVVSSLASEICENVEKTLESNGSINKGLYRTLIELMHNTNNHAAPETKGEELWWLTVHHDQIRKKVSFVFLDWGIGIFKSLKNKQENSPLFGIYNYLRGLVENDAAILEKILKGEIHKTSTGLEYRGKGLSGIYQAYARKQIKNLYIITNDVYADIQNNNYKMMKNEFNGTFVYWEIDKESEASIWKA